MGRTRSGDIPLSVILIGAVFIFSALLVMLIPALPFQVSSEEQTILYLVVLVVMAGSIVMLMKNAKVF